MTILRYTKVKRIKCDLLTSNGREKNEENKTRDKLCKLYMKAHTHTPHSKYNITKSKIHKVSFVDERALELYVYVCECELRYYVN